MKSPRAHRRRARSVLTAGGLPARAVAVGQALSPRRVALVVLAFYGLWIGVFFALGHDPRDFIKIGYVFVQRSHASSVIKFDPGYRYPPNHDAPNGLGYDGQFSYYMALDFANARHYIDDPAYRYTRVLYPLTVRALALGQPGAIPYTMILVNLLAVGLGTLAVAAWLRRRSYSPWIALVYGLYPGLFVGLQRDLTEPLGYSLAAVAVYLFDYGGRRRIFLAGVTFGLAALARQTTVVFAVCYLAAVLLAGEGAWRERVRANWRAAGGFAVLSLLPIILYTGLLWAWLGSIGTGAFLEPVPFIGLVASHDWQLLRQPLELFVVVLPGLAWLGVAVLALRRGITRVEVWCLLANVVLFVVLLGRRVYHDGYTSSGRATVGVVLAAVLCVPYLRALGPQARAWAVVASTMWLLMLPVIAVYGLHDFQVSVGVAH